MYIRQYCQTYNILYFGRLKSILGNPIELASWQCATDNLVNLMVDDLKPN